ncbi:MAG: FlaG/FlaF family flagellin (archaellin) [Halobacteriales archaeon]|jgi:FlaG/FlaF family flagellin (archaellin)
MGDLEEDSGGASSAVGTVLMVALAIVGTMALGVFVFDLSGTQTEPSPDAYLEFSFTNQSGNLTVTIVHRAGTSLTKSSCGKGRRYFEYLPM